MSGLAAFGDLFVVDALVRPGDPAQTAGDIVASDEIFHLGVVALYLVVVLDVVVAWALFRLFAPVSSSLSLPAAWLRLAYAGVLLVAISQLAGRSYPLGEASKAMRLLQSGGVRGKVAITV